MKNIKKGTNIGIIVETEIKGEVGESTVWDQVCSEA